jgi:hypothetical protein
LVATWPSLGVIWLSLHHVTLLQDLFGRYLAALPGPLKAPALRMGWLLFLVLKCKLLPQFPDLVRCATG